MSRAAVTARRIGRLTRTATVRTDDGNEVRVPRRPARTVATRLAVEASLHGVA